MQKIKNIKWFPVLMFLTIIAIASFQIYWLQKAYDREERTLEMRSNYLFRETVFALHGSKLKLDGVMGDSAQTKRVFVQHEVADKPVKTRVAPDQKVANLVDVLIKQARDSSGRAILIKGNDTVQMFNKNLSGRRNRLMQFLFDIDAVQDSVRVKEIQEAYRKKLQEQNMVVPFTISRVPTIETEKPVYDEVTVGFAAPVTYKLTLGNKTSLLLKRISVPIVFSVFLVAFTILSFYLLYSNLLRQKKLADIKNEFISNITHELKTPIATVSVAIEALRNFNAANSPQRTKEYLDISASELQRLSLLVDKVLKLSMFENKEIDLQYEPLSMESLVKEVTSSMRLQFEKREANVSVRAEGDTTMQGDRLHLISVVFNMLDNALKYSFEKPLIHIVVKEAGDNVALSITDSGIGISQEYHTKIFEKFFRVPTDNLHNAKGHGLGLSYVAHVIKKHGGSIRVESLEGKGSTFFITLPKLEI